MIGIAAVACLLAPVAYTRVFMGFRAYDDEGMFLVALRDYLGGQPLMTPGVPLYGPFYYEVYGGLFRLFGILPTHDSGRWLTLMVWLLAAAAGGLFALRLTRNGWLALGGQLVTFVGLIGLGNEPTSTYGLSTLLLIALAGAAALRSSRPRAVAVLIGAIVGALWLIKVNLGVFAGVAVAFAWAQSLPRQQRRIVLPAFAIGIVMFPLVLTSTLWPQTWVVEFALVVAFSTAAIGAVSLVSPTRVHLPGAGWLVVGGLVLIMACLGAALLGGSSPEDMISFLFVFPLTAPRLFTTPMDIGVGAVAWAALLMVAAIAAAASGRELPALVRIGAAFVTWVAILLAPSSGFLLALPLAWIAARPPRSDVGDPVDPYCRLLLPALAVLETLQAYPVAGTQSWLGAVGLMPVGVLLLYDGIWQARALPQARPRDLFAPTAAGIGVVAMGVYGIFFANEFAGLTPLGLPGASSVRVNATDAATLRGIVDSVKAQGCTYLVTYPGMGSFYLWTGTPSSAEMHYDQWYLTIDQPQQHALVSRLESEPRLCVVKNQAVIDFWTRGRESPSGALVDYINANFSSAATTGDYELLVRASS